MSRYEGGHRASGPRLFEVAAGTLRAGDVVREPLIHGKAPGEVVKAERVSRPDSHDLRIRIVFASGQEMTVHQDLPFYIDWERR